MPTPPDIENPGLLDLQRSASTHGCSAGRGLLSAILVSSLMWMGLGTLLLVR
jgi:hypothetical protein